MIYNLCEIGLDKETLRLLRMREMAQPDYSSGMKKAREDGLIEVARNMKADGEPAEKIVRYTGLALDVIEDL